jgi:hypothetical protein
MTVRIIDLDAELAAGHVMLHLAADDAGVAADAPLQIDDECKLLGHGSLSFRTSQRMS